MLGGSLLAAAAGFVNVVLLALGSLPVTHVTGNISRVSGDLGRGDVRDALLVGALALAFLLGSALSGVLIGAPSLRLGRRYGIAIFAEAGLLAAAAVMAHASVGAAGVLATAGAGLQNAMASNYHALIVRTTHVTGIVTDLGFDLGRRIAGHPAPTWRPVLLATLLGACVAGGITGSLAHSRLGPDALWIPAGVLAAAAITYRVAKRRMPRLAPALAPRPQPEARQ